MTLNTRRQTVKQLIAFSTLAAALAFPAAGAEAQRTPADIIQKINLAPAHGRPFFMPQQERTRLRRLIASQEWAKADYARIQAAARKGNGYLAAFLFALDGDREYAPIAQKWLLRTYGKDSGKVKQARNALESPDYFRGGMPHLGSVYYDTAFDGYVAFDWAYTGLEPAARREISEGIILAARYKMRCMDRWWQTPNLMFKPTSVVAVAGLATQDNEAIEWGFRRPGRTFDLAFITPGSHGGYFRVMDAMLKDGGLWHESPIYPIAHKDLYCMAMVSRYLSLAEGKDWWRQKMPSGGSAAGLMDYYVDTAYPIERTGHGPGQIRVATYGDGATNAKGDLFLVNPAGGHLNMTQALVTSYQTSKGDSRLAPFVTMVPDYKPSLTERWPPPDKVALPPAPSKIWPDYGLAMLRSDESPNYWTGDSPAVFQIMGHGYSHDHRDKFAIMLHGAGRLLYPDYNAIQYENLNIGWTRNTVAHSTVMVDEKDTRNAPTTARHDFNPEVKFLACSASGVFEAVNQTRALLLTREYLLDVFQAGSPTPRTFDYLLHSFGKPKPAQPALFKRSTALDKRYWLVSDRKAMTTDDPWSLDFVIKEEPGSRKGKFGPQWYDHTAAVRVTMAAEPKTLVTHGISGIELGKQVKRTFDPLGMLIVRREGIRQTVFTATHEPFANDAKPRIVAVSKLAQTDDATLVRVDAAGFTDYAAVAFGPQTGTPEHVLAAAGDPKTRVSFKNFGYLRVQKDGAVMARGGWTGLSLPKAKASLTLNGRAVRTKVASGYLIFGTLPEAAPAAPVAADCPFPITFTPEVARLARQGRRTMTLTLKNTLPETVSGSLDFTLPEGVTIDPATPQFGPIKPGAPEKLSVTFIAGKDTAQGKRLIPYYVRYQTEKVAQEVRTAAMPLYIAVDPALESVYQYPRPNVFLVNAPRYTLQMHMFHGLTLHLADDTDTVRLQDSPLFTISDGEKPLMFEGTTHAGTWPEEAPAKFVAHAYDRLRYHMKFAADRVTISMDRDYTQFDTAYFTVPGKWTSPRGAPTWARIIAVDARGKHVDAKPGTKLKIAAAELAFPAAEWNLAFAFTPPQPVTLNGTEMKFQIGSLNGDAWSVGFCKPGELDAWRRGP